MAENSKIEWTDHTWYGCTKVSPERVRTSVANWKLPLKWNRDAKQDRRRCLGCDLQYESSVYGSACGPCPHCHGKTIISRPRVFCASLADWLDEEVPIEWLADLLKLIHDTPNVDWLLLTKRPEKARDRLIVASGQMSIVGTPAGIWAYNWWAGKAPENVWLGTSVENQEMADKRIPLLLEMPSKVRFLLCEPLEHVDLSYSCFNGADSFGTMPGIHWVICGGESGPKKRPFNTDWGWSLKQQCARARVPFFFKVDKVRPIPDDLMIRQFPKL